MQFPGPSELLEAIQTWRPEARAELKKHLADHGLSVTSDAEAKLREAEALAAHRIDPRVTLQQAEHFGVLARAALALVPARQTMGTGFTRLVDAKFRLDAHTVRGLSTAVSNPTELLSAIEDGPPTGETAWLRPATPLELVASLVRHLALDAGTSLKLTLDAALSQWLEERLRDTSVPLLRAAGGAGLFIANVASAFREVDALFLSANDVPKEIAERFSERVKLLRRDGQSATPASSIDASAGPSTNYCAEYARCEFDIGGERHFALRWPARLGEQTSARALGARRGGRVILSTPSEFEPGFADLSPDTLRQWGARLDVLYWAGCHYYTVDSPGVAKQKTERLVQGFQHMREGNPALWNHFEYVSPRNPANERVVLEALVGVCDSVDINSTEAEAILKRLDANAPLGHPTGTPWVREWNLAENPATMLSLALALKSALGVRQIQLHGLLGDVVVSDFDALPSPERAVLALFRARQMASNKAANKTGEIKTPEDFWPVWPGAGHRGLVGAQLFADAVAARFGLSEALRGEVLSKCFFRDARAALILMFVPNRGMHFIEGGTTGAGDTIGAGFQLFWPSDRVRPMRTR
ncbi:MAG: hypothetical protein ACKVPX_16410 [Myxococcaceae bacterium]